MITVAMPMDSHRSIRSLTKIAACAAAALLDLFVIIAPPRSPSLNCDGSAPGLCSPLFAPPGTCDQCSDERFSFPVCTSPSCSSHFSGVDCLQCANGWTGPTCSVCGELYQGENCDTCIGNHALTNGTCLAGVCNYPFAGEMCQSCLSGWDPPGECTSFHLDAGQSQSFPAREVQNLLGIGHGVVQYYDTNGIEIGSLNFASFSECAFPLSNADNPAIVTVHISVSSGSIGVGGNVCFLPCPLPTPLSLSSSCSPHHLIGVGSSCSLEIPINYTVVAGTLNIACSVTATSSTIIPATSSLGVSTRTAMPVVVGCSGLSPGSILNGDPGTCGVTTVVAGTACSINCNQKFQSTGSLYCLNATLIGSASCIPTTCSWQRVIGYLNLSFVTLPPVPFQYTPSSAYPLTSGAGTLGACGSTLLNGTSCTIGCSAGYAFSGTAVTCVLGSMSGGPQSCLPIACANPVPVLPLDQ